MIGIIAGRTNVLIGRYGGGVPTLTEAEVEQRIAALQKDVTGRLFALTRFVAEGPEGNEVEITVERPLIARALPTSEPPVRWLENGVCEHAFPIQAVAPHPDLGDEIPKLGFGLGVDRFGGLIGQSPRPAPWYLRLRHRFG